MEEISVATETGIGSASNLLDPEPRRGPAHETRNFDLPSSIWAMMFACYAVFLGALALLVSESLEALGAVLISVCFTVMYFGTATVVVRMARTHRERMGIRCETPVGDVQTLTGKLSYGAAATQVLIVPSMLAFFAVCVVLVRAVIG